MSIPEPSQFGCRGRFLEHPYKSIRLRSHCTCCKDHLKVVSKRFPLEYMGHPLPKHPPHDAQFDVFFVPPLEVEVVGVTELLLDVVKTEVKKVVGATLGVMLPGVNA